MSNRVIWISYLVIFLLFAAIIVSTAVDEINISESCEGKDLHYTGKYTSNHIRCEDDYGNIRWIQR